jgi:flagellar protein FliS
VTDSLDISAGLNGDRESLTSDGIPRGVYPERSQGVWNGIGGEALLSSVQVGRYRDSQVLTATREQLVVLTYDGILRFLGRACRGLETGDYHEKHLGLTRAHALIIELARSLNRSAAPELSASLSAIYAHWLDELALADISDDQPRIKATMALVADLREAWAEAAGRARA